MASLRSIIVVAGGVTLVASFARADGPVTILGTSPAAACAAAAAQAKQTGIGTRFALETCDRAIQTWPFPPIDLAAAYVNRSVIELARSDASAAIADTGAAIRLDRTLAEAYLNRGIALSAKQHSGEAIGDFTKAISLSVKNPELAYFDRAMAREDTGDVKGAYFDYRQAAACNPAWELPRRELARFTVRSATS